MELCVLGDVALRPQEGLDDASSARGILQELSSKIFPILEQLLLVEHDLALLGWRKLVIEPQTPGARLETIREDFQKQAEQIGVLPRSWCEAKLPAIQVALGSLEDLLLAARTWFVRDLELFEAAAPAVTSRPEKQGDWLAVVRDRTTERVARVDHVRDQVLYARVALVGLARSLQPEFVKEAQPISV